MLHRLAIFFVVFLFSCHDPDSISGRVVGIADGDTFTLLDSWNHKTKVRLYGIDCPERGQEYYQQAKMYLSETIFNKLVEVKVIDVDRYGRTVGIATIGSLNVNEALLQSGLAWQYDYYDCSREWANMEKKAKADGVGLWTLSNPTPPWVWRKKRRYK